MKINEQEGLLLGKIGWDGPSATSERVLLRASLANRKQVERNQYVRIEDKEGDRIGFIARVISGPFFHKSGSTTFSGSRASESIDGCLLVELEIQGELIGEVLQDTNSRPMPGSSVYSLATKEIAELHGFQGDMILGNVTGQDDLHVFLQSKNKGVIPRNLGIFGTVGSGKSNTTQVIIEEAARNGWAVVVLDVEGEYTEMNFPCPSGPLAKRLQRFDREPMGISDFHVLYPASCTSEIPIAEPFTLRLADFDTEVITEILQVSIPQRNALIDCVEHLQQKARSRLATLDTEDFQTLLDSSPDAKLPFTLRTLRERANERGPRSTEFLDYSGLVAKLSWLMHAEAFDLPNLHSLNTTELMVPGRVTVIDVSVANDIIKNLVTADLLRKTFALKIMKEDAPPTLLVIEEAHSFISRDRQQTMQATLHMLQNVIRRGRKRWLAIAFVSQQPGHLPSEIFELCNTRMVHALRSQHNLEALQQTTGEVSQDLWNRCPLLGPGQAVLSSPQLNKPIILSVRPATSQRRFIR